ncbi:MAG: hypothetical protein JWM38_1187 [Sphingomonas bacterium]|jgi:hypothetical protein|nr:hypothetical protein [Sphingomonas bacterium]MDB5717760.1 hypothetical protein [Sphingomonas bacterium]
MDYPYTPFTDRSGPAEPKLEFVFEIELKFAGHQTVGDMPSGAGRGFVALESGIVRGPRLNGTVIPMSGGDWALFRPDDVLATDARYMLEADDGTKILLLNRGYLWGREPDTIKRMQDWMFRDGPEVPFDEFYLRAAPSFETPKGPHDWLMRHIFVGIGQRQLDGNTIRYYALL